MSDKLDELLELVNPFQMVNRRIGKYEALHQVNEQLIRDYGYLVEYYSVRDEQKSNGYLEKMKQAIHKLYAAKEDIGSKAGVKHDDPPLQ